MKNIYRLDKNGVSHFIGRRDKTISARIPIEIYNIIMEYEGKTFSEKLINLIYDYKEYHGLKM